MISERTLRQWRKDALVKRPIPSDQEILPYIASENDQLRERILRLTQELMDFYLIRKR